MDRFLILTLLCMLNISSIHAQQNRDKVSLRQILETIKAKHHVKLVYDSSLPLDIEYSGKYLHYPDLGQAMDELLNGTGLKWEKSGDYIMLLPAKKYAVSGYVTLNDGETVINATVQDQHSGAGTLTNQHGFYSLTLPEGLHTIRYSYTGYSEQVIECDLNGNISRNISLSPSEALQEIVVTADLNSPLHTTQTGKISLTAKELNREYSLLSSPDVVKTLQNLSGVSPGTEVTSGLYVHGGGNDENLFLLDGTPLYQINHLGGLFSSFNTDVIKNIDFYKSGFPARYGGRLSSVVDVRTKDGDMNNYHGSFSIGLLDGRIYFEGPIVKGRTSFSFGMRRTWLDLITVPIFALRNHGNPNEKINVRYAFHDINAKITHLFSDRSRIDAGIFSGNDVFKGKDNTIEFSIENQDQEQEDTDIEMQWGNITASVNWKYQFSSRLYAVITGIYTRNRSYLHYREEHRSYNENGLLAITHNANRNNATINDGGIRMELDFHPGNTHHVYFGTNYLMHFFRPQDYSSINFSGDIAQTDTVRRVTAHSFRGHELSAYGEDNIAFEDRWRVNIGAYYTLFSIPGKTYHTIDPRVAVRYQCNDDITLKASYSVMSQYMHQLSNSYLNLPVDYWVPSTSGVRPSRSRQFAIGVYTALPFRISLNVEGFYKLGTGLIEYDGGSSLTPSFDNWENHISCGKSKAYGMEIDTHYSNERIGLNASYTLSWNRRFFPDFYHSWYPDKFDNRHKFNINVTYNPVKGIDLYAGWTYHSGNRMTIPQQLVTSPVIPGVESSDIGYEWIYESPNNLNLATYHRLDLGVNFRKSTKRGHERIWNLSIYNAYCRMNPFLVKVQQLPDGSFRGKSTALFPIMPSFSYTLKF